MATSHYCRGKWRSGSVASCSHHDRLSKKQATVYRGVGEPGGRSTQKKAKAEGKQDSKAKAEGKQESKAKPESKPERKPEPKKVDGPSGSS